MLYFLFNQKVAVWCEVVALGVCHRIMTWLQHVALFNEQNYLFPSRKDHAEDFALLYRLLLIKQLLLHRPC